MASGGSSPDSCSPCCSCRLRRRRTSSRPAYLAVNETAPGQFSVLWRTPVLAGMRLPIVLRLPDRVRNLKEPVVSELSDSLVERRWVDAGPNGLAGERIEFAGLQLTITDVLVRVQMRDGTVSTTLVRPARPWIEVAAAPGLLAVAGAYVLHGIEHILFGFDHLLFVLALILIVRNGRVLLWTITAFTVAHSITLSLATLGVVHVPGPPVEATIALSILLLACEIVRLRHGQISLTSRWPWIVAFSFGLLHGFGFASALDRYRTAAGRYPARAVQFQRRCGGGTAHIYRHRPRLCWPAPSVSISRRSSNATPCRSQPMRSEQWPRSGSSSAWRDLRSDVR